MDRSPDHGRPEAALERLNESGQAVRDEHCPKHGAIESIKWSRDRWSGCRQCNEVLREQQRIVEEQTREQERCAVCLRESGLRGRFTQATFGTFTPATPKQAAVLKACQSYVETLDSQVWGGLWLIGPPGTGKTHLGAGIVQAVIAARRSRAVIATPREIVRDLRATWRRDASDSEDDVISLYASVPLLVLDEVGVGFGTDGELVQLFEVIDRRYQLNRPVVLISNLAAPELRAALGDRMFDRLQENAQVLVCDWPSHRRFGRQP